MKNISQHAEFKSASHFSVLAIGQKCTLSLKFQWSGVIDSDWIIQLFFIWGFISTNLKLLLTLKMNKSKTTYPIVTNLIFLKNIDQSTSIQPIPNLFRSPVCTQTQPQCKIFSALRTTCFFCPYNMLRFVSINLCKILIFNYFFITLYSLES